MLYHAFLSGEDQVHVFSVSMTVLQHHPSWCCHHHVGGTLDLTITCVRRRGGGCAGGGRAEVPGGGGARPGRHARARQLGPRPLRTRRTCPRPRGAQCSNIDPVPWTSRRNVIMVIFRSTLRLQLDLCPEYMEQRRAGPRPQVYLLAHVSARNNLQIIVEAVI